MKTKSRNPVISNIRQRLHRQNRNFMLCFTGATGSGKSYSAMATCKSVDESFCVDRIYFKTQELVKDLSEGKLEKGMAIMLDESGVSFGARQWFSQQSQRFSHLLQIFRAENLFLCMTLPHMGMLDKSGRELLHATAQTLKIDREKETVSVKWFYLVYNNRAQKMFENYPRIKDDKGIIRVVKRINIAKPPQALIRAYEKKRRAFLQETYRSMYEEMASARESRKTMKPEITKLVSQGLPYHQIAQQIGCSYAYVKEVASVYKSEAKSSR